MTDLRSPRLMLVTFVALLVAPSWVTVAALCVAAVIGASRFVRRGLLRPRARSQGLLLGRGRGGRAVILTERELSAHGLLLGASGSGKTTALVTILEHQIREGRPVVAIDMKGSPSFAAQLQRAATAAGRPFKLWTPDGPGFWNPLQYGNPTEGKDKLVATERFTEPHYQRAAERYVQLLLRVIRQAHPDQAPTLDEVVTLMDPARLPALLRRVPQDLADRVQDYRAELSPDQLSAIRGLKTRLALLTESSAGEYLKPCAQDSIDLRDALDGSAVVLFSINSSRYGHSAAQLGTLVVQDLICAAGARLEDRRDAPTPLALVAIDEFSGIGGAHVVALFARGREAGIGALVATQEMADLDRAGRGVRDQVLGSTALKLILRQDVPDSAHTAAQLVGTERVWEETRQMGGTLFPAPPGRGTRREVDRFVIDPNQIKSLRTGEAVLISKLGGRPAEVIHVSPPEPPPPATQATPDRGRKVSYMKTFRPRLPGSAVGRSSAPTRRDGRERYTDPGVMR